MSDDTNRIFQDYLAQHADEQPIDFDLLIREYPQLKEKVEAYKKIMGALCVDAETPTAPSLEGKTVGGCHLIKILGQGGMGVVYLARQENLQRNVVVKVLRPFAIDNEALKERFKRESRIIGRLNHKNIVPVYDVGEENGSLYIIMRYIEGTLLNTFIENFSKTDRSVARLKDILHVEVKTTTEFHCQLIIKVADAVQYAHDNGVIHRDIKPSNIIIEPDGNPVLLDFGLSHDDVEKILTVSGDFLGTPIYSAPESFQKRTVQDDHLLDVYSLGVTLYELLTGGLPYEGDNIYEIYSNIKNKEPIRPHKKWHNIPSDLEIILLKSISQDPELRYQSIEELKNDLFNFLGYLPIRARKPSYIYKLRITFKRKLRFFLTMIVSIFILSTGTYSLFSQLGSKKAELRREKAKDFLIMALDNLKSNNYAAAFNEIKKVYEQYPENRSVAVWYYGLKVKIDKDFDGFKKAISELENKYPMDLYVHLAKVVIYHEEKNYDAEIFWKNHIFANLNDEVMWQRIPIYLNSLGVDEPLVLDFLKHSLERYPQNADLNFIMSALCQKYLKDGQCYKEYTHKAARLSSRYMLALSEVYAKSPSTPHELKNVIAELEQMKNTPEANIEADFYKNMATLYYRDGQCDLALKYIEDAINVDPQNGHYQEEKNKLKRKCVKKNKSAWQ